MRGYQVRKNRAEETAKALAAEMEERAAAQFAAARSGSKAALARIRASQAAMAAAKDGLDGSAGARYERQAEALIGLKASLASVYAEMQDKVAVYRCAACSTATCAPREARPLWFQAAAQCLLWLDGTHPAPAFQPAALVQGTAPGAAAAAGAGVQLAARGWNQSARGGAPAAAERGPGSAPQEAGGAAAGRPRSDHSSPHPRGAGVAARARSASR